MSDERTMPTAKQGQYLAFIYNYTKINGQPPAQADIQRFFSVTPPTVHQMVLSLERLGFLSRTPRVARSLRLTMALDLIPRLE